MKTRILAAAVLLLCGSGLARAQVSGDGSAPVGADGLIQFEPPQAVSCVAVRVPIPEDKMITGLRWYNGTSSEAFPRVLVASGNDVMPPPYSEAVTVAENVQGAEQAWSELVFSAPVASQSGTLFVLLEYPENYIPSSGQAALGIGYANIETSRWYFVTGDGDTWIKVVSDCRVLLEPMLADRTPGVIEKRRDPGEDQPAANMESGLFASPNPFNPETRIDLYLQAPTTGTVKVFDIRGYLVTELHSGPLARGQNRFVWAGQDNSGRAAASGVYWVLAQTADQKFTKKLLLIK